jgi:hypothetical protein
MLCGILSFHADGDGEVVVLRHERRTGRSSKRQSVNPETFDVERVLPTEAIVDAVRRDLFDAIYRADLSHPAPIADYVAWALPALCRELAREERWHGIGDEFVEALDFEPLHVAIARNLPRAANRPRASLASYNLVVRHALAFETLLDDNDNLIAWYALFCECDDFPASGEPIARLRAFLRKRGVSSVVWKRMAGPAGMTADAALACAPASELPMPTLAIEVLRAIDRLGARHDPPAWLVERFTARWLPEDAELEARDRTLLAVARRVAELHAGAEASTREAMREMADLVFHWGWDCRGVEARSIGRMAWTTIARRARRHRERAEAAAGRLPVPFERVEHDGYAFVALSSAIALQDEGFEMRHCVGTYGARCRDGRQFVCSMRKSDGSKERWTAAFERHDRWRLAAISGRANARASARARCAAEGVAMRLNDANDAAIAHT